MDKLETSLTLHFFHAEGGKGHSAPAGIVAGALVALQHAVEYLAMLEEKREVSDRFRVPRRITEKYSVLVEVPRAGSLALPCLIGNTESDLYAVEDSIKLIARFKEITQFVQDENWTAYEEAVPLPQYRPKIADSLKSLIPTPETGYGLNIGNGSGGLFFFSEKAGPALEGAPVFQFPEPQESRAIGTLASMDFEKSNFRLAFSSPNKRKIQCMYPEILADKLLSNRGRVIQVSGVANLGPRGLPSSFESVTEVQAVNLSPMRFDEIAASGGTVRFVESQEFCPELDPSGQLFVISRPEWGVNVFARSRKELEEEMRAQLVFLWEEYALEEDKVLASKARQIKAALLAAVGDIANA